MRETWALFSVKTWGRNCYARAAMGKAPKSPIASGTLLAHSFLGSAGRFVAGQHAVADGFHRHQSVRPMFAKARVPCECASVRLNPPHRYPVPNKHSPSLLKNLIRDVVEMGINVFYLRAGEAYVSCKDIRPRQSEARRHMERQFKQRIESLLKHADMAVTSATNGLLDRGDLIHMIEQFAAATRSLMKANEQLEIRETDLAERLRRTHDFQPVSSLPYRPQLSPRTGQ